MSPTANHVPATAPAEDAPAVEDSDVLVLGGGFAGVWCARRLRRRLGRNAKITLISAENYFVYQPLLPDVVGASLEPRHAISPLRYLCPRSRVIRAEVRELDVRGRIAEVAVPGTLRTMRFRGRHVVVALGNMVDVLVIPGMAQHSLLMKNLADALALRQTLLGRLERAVLEPDPEERAALLTCVVVGGGFSGVETAASVQDLLQYVRRYYPTLAGEKMRVVCVHSRERLIPEIHEKLGQFAYQNLTKRGMEIHLNTRATAVSSRHVYLDSGEKIATRTVVCTIGNAPHPVLRALDVAKDHGSPVADAYLRMEGYADVWMIGDCGRTPDGRGGYSTPTAQFAVRHGVHAADNIVRAMAGRELRPFEHRSLGQLAALGHHMAVAQIGRFRFSGFFAWWLWRTVYLMKLPGLDFKMRVAIDWTLDLVFPRDLTYLDVRTTPAMSTVHVAKGELLFEQGDVSDAFYVVMTGSIELTQKNRAGEVVLREVLGRGAHFGEGSILRKHARTTTARALEPSMVMVIGPRDFDELVGAFALLKKSLEQTSRRFMTSEQVLPQDVPPHVLALPVERVMTTPVHTLPKDATLRRGLEELVERSFSCYPVVDEDGKLVTVATRSDLYAALRGDPDLEAPLVDYCTAKVVCLGPNDSIGRCVEIMRRADVQHVPIVDAAHRVVGMVSFRDLVRERLRLQLAEA